MSTLSLRLPESLHEKVRELAGQDNISINQFITVAVAEKMSALVAEEYLAARAQRGSRATLRRVLAKVRDVAPEPDDELPAPKGRTKRSTRARPRSGSVKRVVPRSGHGG